MLRFDIFLIRFLSLLTLNTSSIYKLLIYYLNIKNQYVNIEINNLSQFYYDFKNLFFDV